MRITYIDGKTNSDFATKVSGLMPATETQFQWKVTRWKCKDSTDVFVYYNKVVANAGKDIYTCDDMAQLHAETPAAGSGRWNLNQASAPQIRFGSTQDEQNKTVFSTESNAWAFNLIQDDNPLVWTVENPMPPSLDNEDPDAEDGNTLWLNGHPYDESAQKSCPESDVVIVHNLRPDDAEIETGEEITTPTPSPGP